MQNICKLIGWEKCSICSIELLIWALIALVQLNEKSRGQIETDYIFSFYLFITFAENFIWNI